MKVLLQPWEVGIACFRLFHSKCCRTVRVAVHKITRKTFLLCFSCYRLSQKNVSRLKRPSSNRLQATNNKTKQRPHPTYNPRPRFTNPISICKYVQMCSFECPCLRLCPCPFACPTIRDSSSLSESFCHACPTVHVPASLSKSLCLSDCPNHFSCPTVLSLLPCPSPYSCPTVHVPHPLLLPCLKRTVFRT